MINSPKLDGAIAQLRPVPTSAPDIVCFSHLRWDFVFQRPQHLMTRFARRRRVLYVEEPIHHDALPRIELSERGAGITVAQPLVPHGVRGRPLESMLARLVGELIAERMRGAWIAWYYTPMALSFTRKLTPSVTVYDCMDELSAFAGAPPQMIEREAELLARADVVFTGGPSLYEAKRSRHPSVWLFPSSIDAAHFRPARTPQSDPPDQEEIASPRIGFFGVLDERFDRDLIREVAAARPEWQFVLIGPVVKIDPVTLPRAANVHYLGHKTYEELPRYIAGWHVAMLPFALNESTRFISPTKTPEYLAAGRRVVSTPIRDVATIYGRQQLVRIARTAPQFIDAIEASLEDARDGRDPGWLERVDACLASMSWDATWMAMEDAIALASDSRTTARLLARASAGGARETRIDV